MPARSAFIEGYPLPSFDPLHANQSLPSIRGLLPLARQFSQPTTTQPTHPTASPLSPIKLKVRRLTRGGQYEHFLCEGAVENSVPDGRPLSAAPGDSPGDTLSSPARGDPNLLATAPCLSASGGVRQPAAQASRRHLPPRKKKARATAMRRCLPLSVRSLTMSWSPRLRRAAQLSCSKFATSCAQRARE